MTAKEVNEYIDFMYEPSNSHNCAECPENNDCEAWPEHRLPCGQFRCWVDCHCERCEVER